MNHSHFFHVVQLLIFSSFVNESTHIVYLLSFHIASFIQAILSTTSQYFIHEYVCI